MNRLIISLKKWIARLVVGILLVLPNFATAFDLADPFDFNNRNDNLILNNSMRQLRTGRQTFRFDTFGDTAFWGDTLHLHQAIAGKTLGGVGPGVSPKTALAVGLKVDVDALPPEVLKALQQGQVNLDDPASTQALLKANAVVGVKGVFNANGQLSSVGITCALCHSQVDNSLAPGIGHRLDNGMDTSQLSASRCQTDMIKLSINIRRRPP